MKPIIRNIILILIWSFISVLSVCAKDFVFTPKDVMEVREKLRQYSKGNISLEEATDGEEWGKKVIAYHLAGTNDVTVKMKLPIARCYAIFSSYTNATQLVSEYLNVYTNDARGWDLLAGAKAAQGLFDEAVTAGTNAVRLGFERNLAVLGGLALQTDRIDVLESMVIPRLLTLKDLAETSGDDRRQMITVLVLYSLRTGNKEVFVKALDRVDAALIHSDSRLKRNVELGCEYFEAKETEALCSQIRQSKEGEP